MKRNRWLLIAIAGLAILSIAAVSIQGVPAFGTLEEFLLWVAQGAGAMLLAGLVVAHILENFAWWHAWPWWAKFTAPFVLMTIFAILAQYALVAGLLEHIPPMVQTIILMLIGWLFSQIAYRRIKDGSYGEHALARAAARKLSK